MPGASRSEPGLGSRARALPRRGRIALAGAPDRGRAAVRRTPAASARVWRLLGPEQRVAAAGALLLAVSTLGSFSWVEGAELLVAAAVLLLLKKRADRAAFHLPFGDGMVIAAAGAWAAILILVRFIDRPLGQSLLALGCAGLLAAAGLRERAKRPADDLPTREAPTERL